MFSVSPPPCVLTCLSPVNLHWVFWGCFSANLFFAHAAFLILPWEFLRFGIYPRFLQTNLAAGFCILPAYHGNQTCTFFLCITESLYCSLVIVKWIVEPYLQVVSTSCPFKYNGFWKDLLVCKHIGHLCLSPSFVCTLRRDSLSQTRDWLCHMLVLPVIPCWHLGMRVWKNWKQLLSFV